MLFFGYSLYSILLGIILIIFRITEGSIHVYIEKNYWKLLNIAKKYSIANDSEKISLMNLYRNILQIKSKRFALTMICWSIGTLAFSIVLITYEIAPFFIGWLGFATSILIGLIDVLKSLKSDYKLYGLISSISSLLAILFEILIGGWLLFFSLIIT